MEGAVAARLAAGDGGPHLVANEAALERAQQHTECQDWGYVASLHLQAGSRMWAVLSQKPQSRLCLRLLRVPALGLLCWGAGEAAGGCCGAKLVPGPPHLLGCFSDDASGVPNKILPGLLLWVKPTGEDLQSREGRVLVR